MTEREYHDFWRKQGSDYVPCLPVPQDLIEEEMRKGGYE